VLRPTLSFHASHCWALPQADAAPTQPQGRSGKHCVQCCDPTVYGTVDGNTVRYRNYGTPPYFVRFSQIWDRITVDYGTVYGTVHNFPRLR